MSQLVQTCLAATAVAEARLIGQDLVLHPRWAWMEGMLARHYNYGTLRIVEASAKKLVAFSLRDMQLLRCGRSTDWHGVTIAGDFLTQCYPDLTDPATVGCLQELVRRAHGAVSVAVVYAPTWNVDADTAPPPYYAFAYGPPTTADRRIGVGRSAIEALALALKTQ